MLVLSRKTGQEIQIGPEVRITIVAVSGKTVRLGISAPREINVWRRELELKEPPIADQQNGHASLQLHVDRPSATERDCPETLAVAPLGPPIPDGPLAFGLTVPTPMRRAR